MRPGSVSTENIHLSIQQLLNIDQPTEENAVQVSQIIQLYENADPTHPNPKLIYKYFNLINLFGEKCDQFVLLKLHNSIFDIITRQFLSCLCKLINSKNLNCKYLLKICMVWWKFIELAPIQLKLKAAQQNISYFQELATVLHKIGHYFIQSKCVEIIFDYVDTAELFSAIFTEKKLQNALLNLSTSTEFKKLSNLQKRLFLNNLNYHAKMEKCQILSFMASDINLSKHTIEKPLNSELWIDLNKSTDSISFITNNSKFFRNDDNPCTDLMLEFYLDNIINVSFKKPNPSEIKIEIALKPNSIFDASKRKYNFSSITMTFVRQSSSIELFQQNDFKFVSNVSIGDTQHSNVIHKLIVLLHQLYKIDIYLCRYKGPNELAKCTENIALDASSQFDDKIAKTSLPEKIIIGNKHQILQVLKERNDSKFIMTKEPATIIKAESQLIKTRINSKTKINKKPQKRNTKTIIDKNNTADELSPKSPQRNDKTPDKTTFYEKMQKLNNEKHKITDQLLKNTKPCINVNQCNGIDETINTSKIIQNKLLNDTNNRQSSDNVYDDTEIEKETHVYNPKTFDDILMEYRKLRQKNKEAKAAATNKKHSSNESSNIVNVYNPPMLLQLPKIEKRRKSSNIRQPKNKNIKKPTNIAAPRSTRLKNSVSLLRSCKYLDDFSKSHQNQLNQSDNEINTNAKQVLNDIASTTNNNSIQSVNHKITSSIAKTNDMKSNKIENNVTNKNQTNDKGKIDLKSNKSTEKAPPSAGLKYSVSLLRGRKYRDHFLKSQRSQSNQLDNEMNTSATQLSNNNLILNVNHETSSSIAKTDDLKSNKVENDAPKVNDPFNTKQTNMKRKIDLNESIQQDNSAKPKKLAKETNTNHKSTKIQKTHHNDDIDQPRRCNQNEFLNELSVPNIVTINKQTSERTLEDLFESDNHNNTVISNEMEISQSKEESSDIWSKLMTDFHVINAHITINDIVPPELQQKLNEILEIFNKDIAEKILLHNRYNKQIDKYKEIQQNAFTLEIMEQICKLSMVQQKKFEEIQNKSLAVIQKYRELFNNEILYARMEATYNEKSIVISREIWQKFIDEFMDRMKNQFQNATKFE